MVNVLDYIPVEIGVPCGDDGHGNTTYDYLWMDPWYVIPDVGLVVRCGWSGRPAGDDARPPRIVLPDWAIYYVP